MKHELTVAEWRSLAATLGATAQDTHARRAAQACLYRYNVRLAKEYRSFGWDSLPQQFGISGKTANRRFGHWTQSGQWFVFWDALVELRCGPARPEASNFRALASGTPLDALMQELNRAYRYFNRRFLGGELPELAVISVEPGGGRRRGYFRSGFWHPPGCTLHHIVVMTQSVAGGAEAALETLMHKMVHLRNTSLGIGDTNPRTQYHTQDFRDVAQLLGLEVGPRDSARGFAQTRLGPRARQAIAELKPVQTVFNLEFR